MWIQKYNNHIKQLILNSRVIVWLVGLLSISFAHLTIISCNTVMESKKMIQPSNAPAPIGPYSPAVAIHHLVFVSGQIALDSVTGELAKVDIETETRMVMQRIEKLLTAAGLNFDHVVKATIFVKDLNHFAKINQVYGSFFKEPFPARETVEVSRLPKDANIEISVIAVRP
jgi:2-iminobutanoate/2-iminopropanoate deaminase